MCNQCLGRTKSLHPLHKLGSKIELSQQKLNPESKPFDPSNPRQWQSNEISNEKNYPIKTLIGEWKCDCYWNVFKSEYFKLDFEEYKAFNRTYVNSFQDPDEIIKNKRPFECILCPQRYRTFKELQHHYRNKIEKPYNCIICTATFKHKYLLWRHRNIHQTLTLLECRGCKKSFRSLLMLKKHFEECRYKLHVLTESEI